MVLVYLTILIISYLCVSFYLASRRQKQFLKFFDGPKPVPIFGSILQVGSNPPDIFKYWSNLCSTYKDNWVFYGFLNEFYIIITNLKDLETILTNTKLTEKSDEYSYLVNWLGTGLLTASGQKWFARRKAITPSFHFNILEEYVNVFNKHSSIYVDILKKYAATNEEVDVYHMTALTALDVICETAMGVEMNAAHDPNSPYVDSVIKFGKIFFNRMFSTFQQFPIVHKLSPAGAEENRHVKILHKFTNDVILKRRQRLLTEKETTKSYDESKLDGFATKKSLSLLDMLLNATVDGKPLSNEDIREEVDTFMFAGHDTTTTAISFLLLSLSRNADIQQKLFEEVNATLSHEKNYTMAELNSLSYFDLVLKESLRMYPPVPLLGRKLLDNAIFNGTTVPAGTNLSISIFAMHRNPDIFPDPLKFDPERFLPNDQKQRHPFSYIPFSAGNRNCIGQKFALLEIKATVSKILLNFKVLPADSTYEPILIGDVVLRSENGVRIRLAPRF